MPAKPKRPAFAMSLMFEAKKPNFIIDVLLCGDSQVIMTKVAVPRHTAPDLLHQTLSLRIKLPKDFMISCPLRLLGAGAYNAARGQDFPPHRHTCWELVFYRAGRIEAPIGDQVFLTRPGMLLLTPPGIVHAERALTAYSNYFITLEAPPHYSWPRFVSDDARGSLAYIFRALVEEHTEQAKKVATETPPFAQYAIVGATRSIFASTTILSFGCDWRTDCARSRTHFCRKPGTIAFH
jgi:mannose-6-phosphate isomerase-like protein (cupin superfamily)